MRSIPSSKGRPHRGRVRFIALAGALCCAAALGDAPGRLRFDIPADDALVSLKAFAEQSGQEILYAPDDVRGARTNSVDGDYTPLQALDSMLAGTALIVTESGGGVLGVRKRPPGPEAGARRSREPPYDADRTTVLNPFEVRAAASNSYTAVDTNSLTAFDIPLNDLPATADILDETFLKDTGVLSVEGAISAFDAGANFTATDVGSNALARNEPGDHNSNAVQISLRGFSILNGGILTDGMQLNFGNYGATSFDETSDYNLERIEVIDGPQALLYTGGGPGGAVNVVTKQAYFDQPAFGEFNFRLDQYGSKYATVDAGASKGRFAIRVSLVDGTIDGNRVNITNALKGADIQLAARAGNTTLRLTLQQSVDTRVDPDYLTLTSAGDPVFSPYNGVPLETLLATGQAGGILGGRLNWSNAESLIGDWQGDYDVSENAALEADSTWAPWLSTKVVIAGANFDDDQPNPAITLYSPGASGNPIPGNWTASMPAADPPFVDYWRPHINKSGTFDVLLTNSLFGGAAESRTSLEGDYADNVNEISHYSYYEAEADGTVIVSPSVATNFGRTLIPGQAWTVNDGPTLYDFFNPLTGTGPAKVIGFDGATYVRQQVTPFSEAASALGQAEVEKSNAGFAVLNSSQWLGGRLDTMIGFRYDHASSWSVNQEPTAVLRKPDESAGAVYHLLPWLSPYVNVADLWEAGGGVLLNGSVAPDSHATTEEAGVKIDTAGSRISGSISVYHGMASNFTLSAPGLMSDVSPSGLNGQVPNGVSAAMASDIDTRGLTASFTATPTEAWRMRLSAAWTGATYTSGATYGQNYNDQFYENAAGEVTYADGTVVNVPSAFNSRQLTVAAGTAGAVPLTAALLSAPGSPYFASPQPITGAILATSNGGQVLLNGASAVHGPILTGATGLPMSDYQLNPALSGVAPLGAVDAVIPGSQTWGYPAFSANLTSVYAFRSGWIKGLEIGGTASAQWKYLASYYYPSASLVAPSDQRLFYLPPEGQFNLITGYTRKLRRMTWSVRLNVDNLFNHYTVILYPDPVSGFSVPGNTAASFLEQPRAYILTNSFRF